MSFYDRFSNNFSIPKSRDLDVDNPGIRTLIIPGFGIEERVRDPGIRDPGIAIPTYNTVVHIIADHRQSIARYQPSHHPHYTLLFTTVTVTDIILVRSSKDGQRALRARLNTSTVKAHKSQYCSEYLTMS